MLTKREYNQIVVFIKNTTNLDSDSLILFLRQLTDFDNDTSSPNVTNKYQSISKLNQQKTEAHSLQINDLGKRLDHTIRAHNKLFEEFHLHKSLTENIFNNILPVDAPGTAFKKAQK